MPNSSPSGACPKCGQTLAPDAPRGLCSRCLFAAILDGGPCDPSPRSAAAGPAFPRPFGPYELLEEVARGGMGIVYKARQAQANRMVAVKVLAAGPFASPDFVKRFHTEAETVASLDHPNIVPIYEVGQCEGQPYFSMRLLDGGSLSERLSKRPTPIPSQEAAALLTKLAYAVHFAHQRGILHRDIKPGNILLDAQGEPSLTDFGLAKLVEKGGTLTRTMALLGTPSYMSPEQARGDTKHLTTAVDVYGLGAVFYELLTGQPPFAGGTTFETVRQVLDKEPRRPSSLNPQTDRDLEIICLKCLEKEPARRYPSSEALARDLERWRRHEPISARSPSAVYLLRKMVRRNKTGFFALTTIALLLISGVTISTWQASVQRDLRQQAEQNERYALQARQQARTEAAQRRRQLIQMHVAAGNKLVGQGDGFRGLLQFVEALRLEDGNAARQDVHRRRLAAVIRTSPQVAQLWVQSGGVRTARFSPDGARVVCGDEKGGVQIYDAKTGKPSAPPIKPNPAALLAWFTPDGRFLATANERGELRHWDPKTGQPAGPLLPTGVRMDSKRDYSDTVDYSADGRWMVAAVTNGVRFFEVATGAPAGPLLASTSLVYRVRLAPDGRTASICGRGPALQIVEVPSGNPVWTLPDLGSNVRFSTFSPDGQRVATASGSCWSDLDVWDVSLGRRTVATMRTGDWPRDIQFNPDGQWIAWAHTSDAQILDARTGRPVSERMPHDTFILQFEFSPDGSMLATASFDRTARVWEAATGRLLFQTLRHTAIVQEARFSPDGQRLLTASDDRTIRLWDLPSARGERVVMVHGFRGDPHIRLDPVARRVLAFGSTSEIRLWDARSGQLSASWKETDRVTAACFNRDGSRVATATAGGMVRLRDLATDAQVFSIRPTGTVKRLEFSPDGGRLLTAGDDGLARIWNASNGAPESPALVHTGLVWFAGFSDDGRRLITGGKDNIVRVWDAHTGALVGQPLPLPTRLMSAAINITGRRLLTLRAGEGDLSGSTQLWDASTGRPIGPEVPLLSGLPYPAAFSPDGSRYLVHYDATSVAICDANTGQRSTPLLEHQYLPAGFAFSPDGRLVLTHANRQARIWDTDTGEPVSPLLTHAGYITWAGWSADGQEIVTCANDGRIRIWDVSPMTAPVEELQRLAELLAAHRLDPQIGMVALSPAELKSRWQDLARLRGASPTE